jgi:hypothetical protein
MTSNRYPQANRNPAQRSGASRPGTGGHRLGRRALKLLAGLYRRHPAAAGGGRVGAEPNQLEQL